MVRSLLTLPLLVVMASTASAANQCTKGSEFEPPLCPLILPKISQITIQENAAKSPVEKDPAVSCANFVLSISQVRRYFQQAKTTNENDAHYTLDWSPCYASGEIAFSDGSRGSWSINQFRGGALFLEGRDKTVLHCPKCKFKPFQW